MFLLTTDAATARRSLEHMASALPVSTGAVHDVRLGSHHLLWMRAQVRDNLHVHPDGAFIGRYSVTEALSDDPVHHPEPMPDVDRSAILPGAVIRSAPEVTVEPIGPTNVFWCDRSVSDRQLLLATLHGLRPSSEGVALLAGIGYFPGNLTLFSEVQRIPYLHRWNVARRSGTSTRTLTLPRTDDAAMIERLVGLVPLDVSHALGLTGGFDSRFALGILHRAGADVRIVRFTDQETDSAVAVAHDLGIELQGVGSFSDAPGNREPIAHTLMTDALVWHGVSQHGRLRSALAPTDLFHSGQASDSMNKNAFRTAWKRPDPRVPYWKRLTRDAFLGNVPAVQPALREHARREDVAATVEAALEYQRGYVDFTARKQWANWLHFMNRGMRWAPALYDDLTFSANLVFLLADIDAQLMGIASGFWDNFNNDRIARLNHQLLPEVRTPYSSGHPVLPRTGPAGAWDKVEYEFIKRFRTRRAARERLQSIPTTYAEALPAEQPSGFDAIFDRPMHEVAQAGRFGLRRANVTVAHVLTYLADAASAPTA